MLTIIRRHLLSFVLLTLTSLGATAAADSEVKILVIFPAQLEPSKVYMMTDGELTRGIIIPFAAIANSAHLKKRSTELGQQLDATLGGYDRYDAIFQALVARFKTRSPIFSLTQTRDTAQYVAGNSVAAAAGVQGYSYVVVIDDKFSGLSMFNSVATRTDDVGPLTTVGFQVFQTKKIARLAKGNATANGMTKKPFREAVNDKEFFVGAYPAIADNVANQLVGTLFKTDVLHAMADSVGRGAEVPQVSVVLKKHEKRFSYDLKPAEGWRKLKFNTKYANGVEPKNDLRLTMGVRFDVDLLVAEFGQKVSTVEDYIPMMLGRLEDSGVDTSNFAEFSDIKAPSRIESIPCSQTRMADGRLFCCES